MELLFDGWFKEEKKDIRKDDIYAENEIDYTFRFVGYFSGFPVIEGIDEEEFAYQIDSVAVYLYVDNNLNELTERNFVPFFDGEEVRNVDIPQDVLEAIENKFSSFIF